jgi:hypothetical protein
MVSGEISVTPLSINASRIRAWNCASALRQLRARIDALHFGFRTFDHGRA